MKRDNYFFGLALAIVLPTLVFGAVWWLNSLVLIPSGQPYLDNQRLGLLSLLPNIVLIRYYLVKLKYDKTGRMLVAVSTLAILALFIAPNYIH